MKRFRDTETWKWIRTLIEIILIVLFIYAIVWMYTALGFSEAYAEDSYPGDIETAYVLCRDQVKVRMFPNYKGEPLGWKEPGDEIFIDGKKGHTELGVVIAKNDRI